ncbi:MAG: TRAP-type C4-dicarboxylate transport system, substrate-binding protein [bacterium]|nr:TRAP-type C4-dicarboxylate transport system, substrate-binding protein [bacterium]
MRASCFIAVAVLALAAPAEAQTVIRMATPVPEGTAWWREIRTFQNVVEKETGGQVRFKIYFGGIAGDELEVGERIRREQLDGAFSGGMLCMRAAPSMRVMRVLGLFQGRSELGYVLGRLKPAIDEEFRRAGFYNLGLAGIGPELIFSRKPIHSLAEAKTTRLWTWGVDDTLGPGLSAVGFSTLPARLEEAGKLYDDGKVDGFIAAPAAALAFQWSARSKYLFPLRLASLDACVIIANRAFDPLPQEWKAIIRNAAAHAIGRVEETSRAQDEALLGGLFARQGITIIQPSADVRAQFFGEARAVRDKMMSKLISRELLDQVLTLLADYRAEHRDIEGAPR